MIWFGGKWFGFTRYGVVLALCKMHIVESVDAVEWCDVIDVCGALVCDMVR